MTDEQWKNIQMLSKAWSDGDMSARVALYDLVVEAGFPGMAEIHLGEDGCFDPSVCYFGHCIAKNLTHEKEYFEKETLRYEQEIKQGRRIS